MGNKDGLTQLPSGSWRWRVSIHGVRHTGTSSSEAKAALAIAKLRAESGELARSDVTIAELLDQWLADVDHAASTAAVRDQALTQLPRTFLALPVDQATPVVVSNLWRQLAAKPVSAHTIRKIRNALSRAFEFGITYGIASSNPTRVARPKPPAKAKRHDPPTPEQVRRLLAATAGEPKLHRWIELAATIGARPGEMCGLQWADLDVQARTLHVGARGISKRADVTAGKKGVDGDRYIDLDKATLAILKQLRAEAHVGCDWMFSSDGVTPWNPDRTARRVAVYAGELGFTDWWLYDLRHYVATQMLGRGVPVADVAKVLGNSPATVMKYYAHAIPGNTRSAVAGMSALLRG